MPSSKPTTSACSSAPRRRRSRTCRCTCCRPRATARPGCSATSRANPHWQAFAGSGAEALAVFRGPHAYVSSAWYGVRPAVPTWNDDVDQARGHATLVEDPEVIAIQMRALASRHEPASGFAMDAQPQDFMARMFKGGVGVMIEVAEWTAKRKQSQNRALADRIASPRQAWWRPAISSRATAPCGTASGCFAPRD
jgi:hypothetical protein